MPTTCKQSYQTRAYNKNAKLFSTISVFNNKQANQLHSADSSFSLPVTASCTTCLASFSTQWVLLCLFIILCFSAGQALKTIYYFLTQNQIWIWPKLVSEYLSNSDMRKLPDFDNIQIRTPSHPYRYAYYTKLPVQWWNFSVINPIYLI